MLSALHQYSSWLCAFFSWAQTGLYLLPVLLGTTTKWHNYPALKLVLKIPWPALHGTWIDHRHLYIKTVWSYLPTEALFSISSSISILNTGTFFPIMGRVSTHLLHHLALLTRKRWKDLVPYTQVLLNMENGSVIWTLCSWTNQIIIGYLFKEISCWVHKYFISTRESKSVS